MGTFEVLDHTADVGFEIRAESLEDLLETAADAAFSVILVDRPEEVEAEEEVRIPSDGANQPDELLVAWLQELLYLFETESLVPMRFTFHERGPDALRARVGFGRFDPERHRTGSEIKAVTYHGLEVKQDEKGRWTARVIVDL